MASNLGPPGAAAPVRQHARAAASPVAVRTGSVPRKGSGFAAPRQFDAPPVLALPVHSKCWQIAHRVYCVDFVVAVLPAQVMWDAVYLNEPCTGVPDNLCKLVLGGHGEMWGETVDASDIQQTASSPQQQTKNQHGQLYLVCFRWLHHAYAVLGAFRARSEAKRNRLARHLPRAERFVFFWYLLGLAAPRRHRRAPVVS